MDIIKKLAQELAIKEEQAKAAHSLRNKYRTQARDLMKDQKTRAILDKEHPNLTWDEVLEKKRLKHGLTGDDAYRDIIRSSATTNYNIVERQQLKGKWQGWNGRERRTEWTT